MQRKLLGALFACLLGCQAAPPPRPDLPEAPVELPPAPPAPAPFPVVDEAASMAVLRAHVLQRRPCQVPGLSAELAVHVVPGPDGSVRGLRSEGTATTAAEQGLVRCVLARVAWWRFPPAHGDLAFTVRFPLLPPSLGDHGAVVPPGGNSVDLDALAHELRRLRRRVLSCRQGGRNPGPRLVLLRLGLGEWGRLTDVQVEADTAPPARRTQAEREVLCLRRVLRQGRFPNPTGPVEARYPYVLAP